MRHEFDHVHNMFFFTYKYEITYEITISFKFIFPFLTSLHALDNLNPLDENLATRNEVHS